MAVIASYTTVRGSVVTATSAPWPTTGEPTYPVQCAGCRLIRSSASPGDAEDLAGLHAATCVY